MRPTRQTTRRHLIPPLGPTILPTITYDIFQTLDERNMDDCCLPSTAEPVDSSDASESADDSGADDPDREDLLDPNFIWDNGHKIRLLGTLQRQRAAELRPPPWTEAELRQADRIHPDDCLHAHTEFVGPTASYGFTLVDWAGLDARPVLDRTHLVIAVAGGQPQADGPAIIARATAAFESAALLARPRATGALDTFVSISAGVGYCEGATHPTNLRAANVCDALALDYISKHEAIKLLCAFGNGKFPPSRSPRPWSHYLSFPPDLFSAFSPRSSALAASQADTLFDANPSLERLFPGAWTSVTFDLGPQTVTLPQWSFHHIRWLWLAITALGNFDPDKGRHLILWDLGRILRFPAGTTVLLPPILRFSIATIQSGETRYSLTQYAAAPPIWSRWPAATALYSKIPELSYLRT
ncbi:hypothetical protein C8R44DRAFT_887054 [Mycena epipterygia]|nr:hypothetical protein C8R44DRAFT_887054 [Mycena epipterygia]